MQEALSSQMEDATLTQEFDSIDAYLQALHETIHEGRLPNIADLDNRIARLCDNVKTAKESSSHDIQKACLARLDSLLRKLNDCENEMIAFHNQSQAQ